MPYNRYAIFFPYVVTVEDELNGGTEETIFFGNLRTISL